MLFQVFVFFFVFFLCQRWKSTVSSGFKIRVWDSLETLVSGSESPAAVIRSYIDELISMGLFMQLYMLLTGFKVDSEFHWEPVKGCNNRCNIWVMVRFLVVCSAPTCDQWCSILQILILIQYQVNTGRALAIPIEIPILLTYKSAYIVKRSVSWFMRIIINMQVLNKFQWWLNLCDH